MGCNCKAKSANANVGYSIEENEGLFQKVVKNIIKVFVFLVSLLLLPFIMGLIIWYMFEMLVLNQNLDLAKILGYVIKKAKRFDRKDDDEEFEDDDDLTEDDVTLLDADEITEKSD